MSDLNLLQLLSGISHFMIAYAYLRVSTDHQDLDNQRHGILEQLM